MGNFAQRVAAQKAAPAAAKAAAASTPEPNTAPARAIVPKTQGAAPAKPAPVKVVPPAKPAAASATAEYLPPGSTLSLEERLSPGQGESLRDAGLLGPNDTVALPSMSRPDSVTSWLMNQPESTSPPELQDYRERLAKVAALRGTTPEASAGFGLGALFSLPESDWVGGYRRSVTPSAGTSRQAAPEPVSLRARTGKTAKPTDEALKSVAKFKAEAEAQGMKYKAARDAIGQLERMTPKLEARKDAQAPAARAQLAQMMRAKQQDLTDALASLREFGFDEAEAAKKFK